MRAKNIAAVSFPACAKAESAGSASASSPFSHAVVAVSSDGADTDCAKLVKGEKSIKAMAQILSIETLFLPNWRVALVMSRRSKWKTLIPEAACVHR